MNEDIYTNDINNRFPTFTLTKSTNGSFTTFELKDGPTIIARARGAGAGNVIFKLRSVMVGGVDILPIQTPTQRDSLTGLIKGQHIIVNDNGIHKIEFYDGSVWKIVNIIRIGHTYAISGEIKIPLGDTDFINPFFVSLASGQTVKLVKARHKINSGTSVTCKLQKNGVDITGFTGVSVTTTAADTDPTDVTLSDNDKLALVVTAISGGPKNMSFTIFLEHT